MKGSLMIQGTSSGAGKTLITAMVCRYLKLRGLDVAPFKAQNLSLNSFVTKDGREIGISQAFQSWACGIEPDRRMNPVLLKPRDEGSCQIILNGKPYADVGDGFGAIDRDLLLDSVERAYRELHEQHDIIILEGSGSPAEVNLRDRDIANMITASMANSPVVLVGDIERGGVFAALFGTYHLIEEKHRSLVKGFMINRFRGKTDVLRPGIISLEEKMKIPCLGVIPYLNLRFPSEDCLDMGAGGELPDMEDIRKAWMSNLDIMLREAESKIDFSSLIGLIENAQ